MPALLTWTITTKKKMKKKKSWCFCPKVGCATTCCPWRTGKTWERAAGFDARSMTTASPCLEAPSLSPVATSTLRYQAAHAELRKRNCTEVICHSSVPQCSQQAKDNCVQVLCKLRETFKPCWTKCCPDMGNIVHHDFVCSNPIS